MKSDVTVLASTLREKVVYLYLCNLDLCDFIKQNQSQNQTPNCYS